MASLSSRERLLLAIDHAQPDHVPFLFNLFDLPQKALPKHLCHRDQVERAQRFVAAGLDDTLSLSPPWRVHPEVSTRVWKDQPAGEPYTLIHKVYQTPKGELTQVVKQTEDWPHGDDIGLFSDHNVPRSARFLIETEQDLEKLPYILSAPSEDQVRESQQQAEELQRAADDVGVAVEGHCGALGDVAVWLCGAENFMIACHERPEFAREVLRVIHKWEMDGLRRLLDVGVCDIITHRAWYESPAFYSPALFREFLFAGIKEEVDLVHQAGRRYQYVQTIRPQVFAREYLDLGIDVLWGVDPVQGNADMAALRRDCGNRICFIGGVNSYLTVARGTREEVRAAVREAIDVLGPESGFALLLVDSVDKTVPWSRVEWVIEDWRKWGTYPLST
jgi:uroporphyrinogen decarboxylase